MRDKEGNVRPKLLEEGEADFRVYDKLPVQAFIRENGARSILRTELPWLWATSFELVRPRETSLAGCIKDVALDHAPYFDPLGAGIPVESLNTGK
jgi:hypothetical protein